MARLRVSPEVPLMPFQRFLVLTALVVSLPASASVLLTDGDFGTATLSNFGTTTTSRLETGGNPGARIQITTVSGAGTGGLVINDTAVTGPLEGASFDFGLSVLKGAGSFGQGQAVGLALRQGSTVWVSFLYITGVRSSWTDQTAAGTLRAADFNRVVGTATGGPALNGSVTTYFGFYAANSNSGTLTQYYDNFKLTITPGAVPAPGAAALVGLAGLIARRRKA